MLEQHLVKLVVENDQTPDCGSLSLLSAFFHEAENNCLPVRMTFDMVNWQWVGQDALAAAEHLACHVSYVHVKAVTLGHSGWRVIAPAKGAIGVICWLACRRRRHVVSNSHCKATTWKR